MPPVIDLTGQRFERLLVVERTANAPSGKVQWLCRCDCGVEKAVGAIYLRQGRTQSCGCLNRERRVRHGGATREGGHALYGTWESVRQRCNNPNNDGYPYYGGRGITVDPRWDSFAQFLADMGPKPEPGYSLDRIDNDGPYSPENCRWATQGEQNRNRRRTSLAQVSDLAARIAELEAENARLLSLIPHDAQEAA